MNVLKTLVRQNPMKYVKKYSSELTALIKNRRSVRSFEEEPVSTEIIEELIETAIWAPTASNRQPLRFYVVNDMDLLKEISDVCIANFTEPYSSMNFKNIFYNCPTAIFVNSLGHIEGHSMVGQDVGMAVQCMELKAEEMGLSTCTIGLTLYGEEFVLEKLGAEEGECHGLAMLIGHGAKEPKAPPRREPFIKYM